MNLINHNLSVTSIEGIPVKEELHPKLHSLALFDDMYAYYNCSRVFYAYFGEIPNILALKHLDPKKVIHWMESRYAADILRQHYRKVSKGKGKGFSKSNAIYILKNNLLVDLEGDRSVRVYFTSQSEEQARMVAGELECFIEKPVKHNVAVVLDKGHGLELVNFRTKRTNVDLGIHYNDDLLPVHRSLVKKLGGKNSYGLVLLHGAPGTGKSTYIRFLVQALKKKAIFLPAKFAGSLDAPELINIMYQHSNSILVIEDAELLLSCRESGYNSNLSTLLNLTDGMLGETLGIPVIATFNTRVNNIDKALLRKGRLHALYEFKPLAAHKTNALLENRGIVNGAGAMTLAEIFHYPETTFSYRDGGKKELGFKK